MLFNPKNTKNRNLSCLPETHNERGTVKQSSTTLKFSQQRRIYISHMLSSLQLCANFNIDKRKTRHAFICEFF